MYSQISSEAGFLARDLAQHTAKLTYLPEMLAPVLKWTAKIKKTRDLLFTVTARIEIESRGFRVA